MKHLILYTLLAIFVVEAKHIVKRVVGGYPASPGQFPFQISIRNQRNDHICGGTIIATRFVLTAGHCLYERHPRDITVVAGTNKLSKSPNIYHVDKIAHGNYDSVYISNDISMIKLAEDIIFTELIQPLALQKLEPPYNVSMIVSGWGYKHFGDAELPNRLHYEEVTAISLDECIERYSDTEVISKLTNNNICTFTKNGEGVCNGDSGGPLIHEGKLVGIVSHGIGCALGYPDIYTKVSNYYNWIQVAISAM